jgi:hypothetical protein
MKVYSIDVKIVGTAYIRAASVEEAKKLFLATYSEGQGGEIPTGDGSPSEESVDVSGRQYDDPDLPGCSLSPAISFYGPADAYGDMSFEIAEEISPP